MTTFKGSVRERWKGYRLTVLRWKISAFDRYLSYLYTVVSIRSQLSKMTIMLKKVASIQNLQVAIGLGSKPILQILQPIIKDNFWTHPYIVDQIVTFEKFIPVSRIFDNENDIFIFSKNVRKSSASRENKL